MKPRPSVIALLAALIVLVVPSSALADHTQYSIMQDDTYLIYSSQATVIKTLQTMEALGVQQVRVNMEWANIAPDPTSTVEPANFDPANPNDYPAANWAPYDFLAAEAPLHGITVQFNITSPGPEWGMGPGAPATTTSNGTATAEHWDPNISQFEAFVVAVGARYSGSDAYIPRVSNWSIWNEPNQPGWLAPQWSEVNGKEVAQSPRIYRGLVEAGYYALYLTGHAKDTFLFGDTAPEGNTEGDATAAMDPGIFLRDLYCVGSHDRRLTGTAAQELGCPTSGTTKAFVKANLGLFMATGFAHHPYDFTNSPTTNLPDANEMPLADIGRLQSLLKAVFKTYDIHRNLPLYFTEYGYESKPPDPHRGVPLATQAAWLNESDYMSWRDPDVRSVAQFLLYDAAPNPDYQPNQYDYWDTFQTGLLYLNGTPKPSFDAYRMPIWIPNTHFTAGTRTFIWGQARPADADKSATISIQWKPSKGSYKTLGTVTTGKASSGYFTDSLKLPGNGYVRTTWKTSFGTLHSRAVPVLAR